MVNMLQNENNRRRELLILFHYTHWGVDEVQHVCCSLVPVEHGGCLCLHCDPSLPLHWEAVQHLLVSAAPFYHTCMTNIATAVHYWV